jgi:CRP/FNR family transcriptional regulator
MTDPCTSAAELSNGEIVSLWLRNPMFAAGGAELCARLAVDFPARRYAPGEAVVADGDPARGQGVVLSGMVRVFQRAVDGREQVVKLLMAPATFGEMELVHDLPFLEHVAAVSEALIAEIPLADYLQLLADNPAMMMEQLRNLSGAFCVAARSEKQLFAPLEQRLANLLLSFADRFGAPGHGGLRIGLPLPQRQLAQSLGVTRRGVINVLNRWREAAVVRRDGEQVTLLDPESLEELAAPIRGSLSYHIGMPLAGLSARPAGARARLLVEKGPRPCLGRHASIHDSVLVGRAAHCPLLLPDETVSPVHCRVFLATTGGKYWVEDLDSLNGTLVNDRLLSRRAVLHDGDRITLGATTLAFELSPQV